MVEYLLPKQKVAGSNPVSRSNLLTEFSKCAPHHPYPLSIFRS